MSKSRRKYVFVKMPQKTHTHTRKFSFFKQNTFSFESISIFDVFIFLFIIYVFLFFKQVLPIYLITCFVFYHFLIFLGGEGGGAAGFAKGINKHGRPGAGKHPQGTQEKLQSVFFFQCNELFRSRQYSDNRFYFHIGFAVFVNLSGF